MLRKLLKKYRKSSTEESLPHEIPTSSQLTQQPVPLSTQAGCGLQSASNDVVCTGWLEKSPPEKKLERYAWKKRWFILRRGQMRGDPDVLEYYKNDHSKKPLRVINLNFCNHLGVGVTFNKKELQKSFMFDIKTNERTFYLVAETEADMNRWVQSICQICGFSQTKGSTDALRNLPSVSHSHRSSPAEFSSSSQHLFPARRSSALSHSSQLPLSSCIQPAVSSSAPQEYQHLHQCISGRTENARNASFSQRNLQESGIAAQNLAQGNRHYINRVSSQVHDFYSLTKPSQYSGFDLPHSLASHSHTKGNVTGSLADSEDVYTYKAHRNKPCREFGDLPLDPAIAPPRQHPKTPWWNSPQQRTQVSDYKYPTKGKETACLHAKSPNNTIMGQSDNASFSQSNLQEGRTAAQKLARGNGHSINRVSSQDHDFYSIPKPSQYSGFDLPRSLASYSHTKGSLTGSAAHSGDVYTFKVSRNTCCREFGNLPVDSAIAHQPQHPKKPWCGNPQQRPRVRDYKYPKLGRETACLRAKSPNNTIVGQSDNANFSQYNLQDSHTAAQELAQGYRHSISRVSSQVHDFYGLPKPSQYSVFDLAGSLASHSHSKSSFTGSLADREDVYTFKSSRNTQCREFGDLPVDSAISPPPLSPKTPPGSSPQQSLPDSAYKYPIGVGETASWCDKSPKKTIVSLPNNASSDDSYVSVNPGSDIPMSTMPHHIASRGSEIQPPPLYRHLKPGQKAKPELLDLINNNVVNELPFNPSSSQDCRSISIADSGDCEKNSVPMQNPTSSSPVPSGTNNPAPKNCTG